MEEERMGYKNKFISLKMRKLGNRNSREEGIEEKMGRRESDSLK